MSAKRRHKIFLPASLLLWAFLLVSNAQANSSVRYRFLNEQGVPVISNNLPAKYAQNGYEILDGLNNVVKVIPPAPSEEDVEKAKQERQAVATFEILKRRYSSVDDIERAKQRKLKNIDTNISILKGNISNLESAAQGLIEQAANFERAGRNVPKTVLKQLSDTRAELKVSRDLLEYREQEYQETTVKFNQDISAFILGESLDKKLNGE